MNLELILTIVAIAVVVGALLWLYYNGKQEIAKKIILNMVIKAEEAFLSGTGLIKKNYVIAQGYSLLPAIVKFFVTEDMINDWIEDAVDYIKTELTKDGKTIEQSIKDLFEGIE